MKRQIFFGTVLAAAMSVGLGAQQYGSSSQNQSEKSNTVTVTGCVEPSSQSAATGTTGSNPTSSSASTDAKYMLTNVAFGASSSSASSMSSSTAGTTGAESNVMLEGKNLSQHEGRKVEVKGHWADGSSSSPAAASSSATGSSASGSTASSQSPSSASSASSDRTLRVSSIKDIAQSCSGH